MPLRRQSCSQGSGPSRDRPISLALQEQTQAVSQLYPSPIHPMRLLLQIFEEEECREELAVPSPGGLSRVFSEISSFQFLPYSTEPWKEPIEHRSNHAHVS